MSLHAGSVGFAASDQYRTSEHLNGMTTVVAVAADKWSGERQPVKPVCFAGIALMRGARLAGATNNKHG